MNKDLNAVDCHRLCPRNDKEQGRSMVEMLGTLAIVGVLSVGAIGGYSYAMNKHRTNELIYEATKRAQWVGTQLEMNNSNPSIHTFGTDSFGGGRFTGEVVQLENGQIGIKVADLKEAICDAIKDEIGDNTVLREMRDVNCDNDSGTATLVFNRDLSITDSPNSGSQGGNEPEPEEPQEPEEPTIDCGYHGEQVGSVCECDYGWAGDTCSDVDNDRTCSGHGTFIIDTGTPNGGYCACNFGYYGAKCSEQTVTSCIANSDCDEGYYCKYTSGLTATSKENATGQCIKISTHRAGSKNGYTWSNTGLDWFSAENFCDAQGKHMPTIDSFQCYRNGTSTVISAGSSGSGFCCKDDSGDCSSYWDDSTQRAAHFSSKIVAVKDTTGTTNEYWTQSNASGNGWYVLQMDRGVIGFWNRPASFVVALCE